MVQANADGRPRSRRARQSEEQAPLVESYLSGSTSYQGTPHPGAAHGALGDFLLTWTGEGPSCGGCPGGQRAGTGGGRLGSGAWGKALWAWDFKSPGF